MALTSSMCSIISLLLLQIIGACGDERTLAMVKPDGVRTNNTAAIKSIILSSGFLIIQEKALLLDVDTAEIFYWEHKEKPFFQELIEFMTSGSAVAMILEHENAVAKWRSLIGPTDPKKAQKEDPNSIRAMFGTSTTQNCVHGSDSTSTAEREIKIIFEDSLKRAEGMSVEHDEF